MFGSAVHVKGFGSVSCSVQPRTGCWREVEGEALMPVEPSAHARMPGFFPSACCEIAAGVPVLSDEFLHRAAARKPVHGFEVFCNPLNADVLVCAKLRRYYSFPTFGYPSFVDGICFFLICFDGV